MSDDSQSTVSERILGGGSAASIAVACTNPFDVVKVRLQLERQRGRSSGALPLLRNIVEAEGPGSLTKGTGFAMLRGLTYGGLRLGMYEPVKARLAATSGGGSGGGGFGVKLAAGISSGAAAAAITNPLELLKATHAPARRFQDTAHSRAERGNGTSHSPSPRSGAPSGVERRRGRGIALAGCAPRRRAEPLDGHCALHAALGGADRLAVRHLRPDQAGAREAHGRLARRASDDADRLDARWARHHHGNLAL